MNAPTQAAHVAEPNVKLVPLAQIILSTTRSQEQRRKTYDAAALAELATSIKEDGVMFAILVRPLASRIGEAPAYEIIAGERRFLASQQAGIESIPARILALTDAQVQKAQLVENIQREALDTLAEAMGYEDLIKGGIAAEVIGDMIGKSRSYVYARVQLLKVAPGVRKALSAGELTASQALLFARIPSEKLQEAALGTLRKWDYQGRGEPLSFRRTASILNDKAKGIFIPLVTVPFKLDDATYHTFGPKQGKNQAQDVIALPTCIACPKRSGNDPELQAALEDPNVCTDKACHDVKAKQALERRRKEIEADGIVVLRGEEAAAIMPTDFGTRGYVDLDSQCDADEFPEAEPDQGKDEDDDAFERRMGTWEERADKHVCRTYRQLLGDDIAKLDIRVVEHQKGNRFIELAPDKAVAKLLKEKGIEDRVHRDTRQPSKPVKTADPETAKRQAEKEAAAKAKQELEQKITREVQLLALKGVHDKWKGPLDRDELEILWNTLYDNSNHTESFDFLYPKHPKAGAMNLRDLGRAMLMLVVCDTLEGWNADASAKLLKALAARLKVDVKSIEKSVRAELDPTAAPKKPAAKSSKKK